MKGKTSNASKAAAVASSIQSSLETLNSSGITSSDGQTTVAGSTTAQEAASTSISVRDQVISAVGSSAQNLQTVAKEFVAMDVVIGAGFGLPGGKQP
ncbi:TIGR04197 family type VII secretion effector [uncultured Enterococcus sp.]|uniref:TIGR04197 family type VII secretion effector n=1 Tax=uncultured Enterococcus sp. TaxID=167972 RepID=UPI002AA7DA1D|nr:TIGR04197 family type VII secretion effector [uncultured Enterococcus sp.]